ncbi:hypothetical protein FACS1894151_02620 [Spirochaetia bacterium]|nr:hypothetical protein FACS1894151_02620 [Spirochaetia bacterium]
MYPSQTIRPEVCVEGEKRVFFLKNLFAFCDFAVKNSKLTPMAGTTCSGVVPGITEFTAYAENINIWRKI